MPETASAPAPAPLPVEVAPSLLPAEPPPQAEEPPADGGDTASCDETDPGPAEDNAPLPPPDDPDMEDVESVPPVPAAETVLLPAETALQEPSVLPPGDHTRRSVVGKDSAELHAAMKDPAVKTIVDLFEGRIVDIHR